MPGLASAMTAAEPSSRTAMPVSAPAIQRKSRDRCACSIAGCTRAVKSRFSRSVTAAVASASTARNNCVRNGWPSAGRDQPRQDRRGRVDDRHDAPGEIATTTIPCRRPGQRAASGVPGRGRQLAQVVEQLVGRRVALGRRDAQAPADDRIERRRSAAAATAWPDGPPSSARASGPGSIQTDARRSRAPTRRTPNAKRSVRASISPPLNCSGAM